MRKIAIRYLVMLAFVCAIPAIGQAQTTAVVSATVTDPNGTPCSGGIVKVAISPTNISPTVGGVTFALPGPALLDINGHFSMTLFKNSSIDQAGTRWVFTVNCNSNLPPPVGSGGQVAAPAPQNITVDPTDLSATISAALPLLTNINAIIGSVPFSGISNGTAVGETFIMGAGSTLSFTGGGIINASQCNGAACGSGSGIVSSGTAGQVGIYASTGTTVSGASGLTTDAGHGSLFINGPTPWRDVTAPAFGAKCDGVTDDSAAFTNAWNAAVADGGGTMYIPQTASFCLAPTWTMAATGGIWVTIIQVGTIHTNVSVPSFTYWTGNALGSASGPTSFQFEPAATIQGIVGTDSPAISIFGKQAIFLSHLKVIGAGATAPAISGGSIGGTGSANVTFDNIDAGLGTSADTGDAFHWSNTSSGGGFGLFIKGGAYSSTINNTNHASIYISDTGIMNVSPDFLGTYGIRLVHSSGTGGGENLQIGGDRVMVTETLLDTFLILQEDDTNGLGGIHLNNIALADGSVYYLRTQGSGAGTVGNIYLTNVSGGTDVVDPASTKNIVGLWLQDTTPNTIPIGSSGGVQEGAAYRFYADTTAHGSLNAARGHFVAGMADNGNMFDTHHFVHPVDGGVGNAFGALDPHTIVRFDSANANSVITYEGPTNGTQFFSWSTSSGGASLFHNSSEHTFRTQVTGGTATSGMTLYGTTAGGFPAAPFALFSGSLIIKDPTGSTINWLQITGVPPTGGNTATFQDASGTVPFLGTAQTWTAVQTFNNRLQLDGTTGHASIGVAAAAGTPNPINLPTSTGTSGQILSTDGANPQQLSWITTTGSTTVNGKACALGGSCTLGLGDISNPTATTSFSYATNQGASIAMLGTATNLWSTDNARVQFLAAKNTTAAIVGTSQGSPGFSLCGRAFHSSADVEDCMTLGELPGNGNDAAITFNYGHTGTSTGAVTHSFAGLVTATTIDATKLTGNLPAISGASLTNIPACATCVVASSPGAGLAHFAGSTQTVTSSAVIGSDMTNNTVTATQLAAQYSKWAGCGSRGIGDGLNAIPAGTYLQFACVNDTGVTITITGIHCWTDNAGTSTLNAANNAGTALLTGAVTCNATKASGGAAGSQSATTTLANGDAISFTFVADGTSKQTNWNITITY